MTRIRGVFGCRMQLGTMRQAEFRVLQKLYREAYKSCLAACGNRYDPELPAVQRLMRLMAELDAMHGALVLTQPDRMLHFLHGLDEVRHDCLWCRRVTTQRLCSHPLIHATFLD